MVMDLVLCIVTGYCCSIIFSKLLKIILIKKNKLIHLTIEILRLVVIGLQLFLLNTFRYIQL